MNARIKELIELCTIDIETFEAERFAELIIAECKADPMVYLLNELCDTDSDAQWKLAGWTSDIKVAHAWRTEAGRGVHRNVQDIYFVKRIT